MPFADGPSPIVWPWLLSLACLAGLLVCLPLHRPHRGVWALFGGLALAACLRGPGLPMVNGWTLVVLGTGLLGAALGAATTRDAAACEAIAEGWLLAALLSCGMALCQYAGLAAYFDPWMNEGDPAAAYANVRQRNHFATLTSLGLVSLLWGLARGRWRAAAPWLLALLALGNASSLSRTGLGQWAVLSLAALLGWRHLPPPVRRVAVWALPAYLLAACLLPYAHSSHSVWTRLADTAPSCHGRAYLWSNVWDLIVQKPWLGWGWRELAWAHFVSDFPQRFCDIPDNAHNLPLHWAVELGVPLALLFSVGLGALLLGTRPWAERQPQRQWAWWVLLFLLLHSLVEYPLWYGPFQLAFGFVLGVRWPAPSGASTAPHAAQRAWLGARVGARVGPLALALGVAYAAWDYHRVSQLYLQAEARDRAYQGDTLAQASASRLFVSPVRFAELLVTPLTAGNAAYLQALALQVLHYSPEPRVIEVLIDSSRLLGDQATVSFYTRHYQAAFPQEYGQWRNSGR